MEKAKLDVPQVLEILDKIVNKVGRGHVITGGGDCRYFDEEGNPVCLIGYVLAEIGITLEMLEAIPAWHARTGSGFSAFFPSVSLNTINISAVCRQMPDEVGSLFTPNAITVLHLAQSHQDQDKTWGYALDSAREYVAKKHLLFL